jgi:hypothetical protein
MTARSMLAAFHLLALGIGLGAVWARALRAPLDSPGAFNRVCSFRGGHRLDASRDSAGGGFARASLTLSPRPSRQARPAVR